MAHITFEQTAANAQEQLFADSIQKLVTSYDGEDCRQLAPALRVIANSLNVDMAIGCGGSHIYIHRASEFVVGDHTNANNIRWAIITD